MSISLQVFLLLLLLFLVPTRISTFEINSNRNNRSIHHNKKTNSRRRRRRRTSPSSALSVLSSSALFSASATTTTSMTTTTTSTHRKHLILVGGGHAHVQVIKALNTASRPANMDVTLIDLQQSASYSGMVPGCVADLYTAEETLIHLKPLAAWAGITFLQGQVIDIDPNRCRMTVQPVTTEKNEGSTTTTTTTMELEFDAVSMDIGSTSRGLLTTPGALTYTLPTRPISALVSRFEHETQTLLERVQQTTSTTANKAPPVRIRVVVIGAGNAGLELAMATMGRWKAIVGDENITVTLLDSGSRLVPHETLPNQQALVQALADHAIHVRYNCGFVHEVREDRVILNNSNSNQKENTSEEKIENEDNEIPFDYCLWATGAEAHEIAFELNKKHGLAITDRGWIRVNPYLQSISHPCIFAAGDCNTIENGTNKSPPKAGVYAVRSGPILIENLTKFLTTTDTTAPVLKAYTPQDDFLKLLVCGDGTALGFRFGIPFYGKWVFELKDTIDRNFMNLFKAENLPQLLHATEKTTSSSSVLDTSQYDVSKQRRAPISPADAATLLQRHDDDVNFREAWDVIKDMSDDEHYRNAVLESYLK